MKKYIYSIMLAAGICSCNSSQQYITVRDAVTTAKEVQMTENNSRFSTVGIVGEAAEIAKIEEEKIAKKKNEDREKKLSQIKDISYSKFKDEHGNDQFKAVIDNALLFKFDSFELSDSTTNVLSKLVPVIKDMPTRLLIVGHTDSVGEESYNMNLSQNRALSVANFLIRKGINPNDIEQEGKGESSPVASNTTKAGQAKNRRVEIFMYNKE